MTKLSVARAKLREWQAKRDEYQAKMDAMAEAQERERRAIDRMSAPVLLRRSSGDELCDLKWLSTGWTAAREKTAAAIRKVLLDGAKMSLSSTGYSGQERTAKSFAKALRRLTTADERHLKSLDRRIAKLQAERQTLLDSAWERGLPFTEEAVIETAISLWRKRAKRDSYADYKVGSDLRYAEMQVGVAQQHLDHLTGGSDEACPCKGCEFERKHAEYEKQHKAYAAKQARHRKHTNRRYADCTLCDDAKALEAAQKGAAA